MDPQLALETAHRFIERDHAVREAGGRSQWNSVRKMLEFVAHPELLGSPEVQAWLRRVANESDFWTSRKLLEIVVSMLDSGMAGDAHTLYRCVVGLDNAQRWEKTESAFTEDSMLVDAAYGPILGRPGLLASWPGTWGRTACDLFGGVLLEHERREWPLHLEWRRIYAEQSGEPFEKDQPFEVKYDDNPDIWYFPPDATKSPRHDLGQVIEQGLRDAAQLTDADCFQQLSEYLLTQRFAVGMGLLLVTLLDCFGAKSEPKQWHGAEAIRLLSLDAVQEHASLSDLRQLLRRQIVRPDKEVATALANAIRRSAIPDVARLCEFADMVEWNCLAEGEVTEVSDAAARNELFPPRDPRQQPIVQRGICPTSPAHSIDSEWPHREDGAYVVELAKTHLQSGTSVSHEARDEILPLRLKALAAVLSRPERDADRWKGEILGWCYHIVSDLKMSTRHHLHGDDEHGELTATEWQHALDVRAPWWMERVQVALQCIRDMVPSHHFENDRGGLVWGTSDPIYQSLNYLNEVLAMNGGKVFEDFQCELEVAVDAAWESWPPFTRATTLCVLQVWFWWKLPRLRARLSWLAKHETMPLVNKYGVNRLLEVGGANLAEDIECYLKRVATLSDRDNSINQLGRFLGQAYILHRVGEAADREVVTSLAKLFDQVRVSLRLDERIRKELSQGLLWGASDQLREVSERTELHAKEWLSLVRWSVSQWPFSATADDERFPIYAITSVLEQLWPQELRQLLLSELVETFCCVIRQGTLADFCWLHHELKDLISGNRRKRRQPNEGANTSTCLSDSSLVAICFASAVRVAEWRSAKKTTNDLGWVSALSGHDTAELIQAVVQSGHDREFLRREIPPIVDQLANAGCTIVATELRIYLRRV